MPKNALACGGGFDSSHSPAQRQVQAGARKTKFLESILKMPSYGLEQILQIVKRVDALPPATAQQPVNDRTALACGRMPNEHPVLSHSFVAFLQQSA